MQQNTDKHCNGRERGAKHKAQHYAVVAFTPLVSVAEPHERLDGIIRRAVQVQYGLRKLPDPKRLEQIARPWRPYRTLACLYLWSSLDNKPGP